MNDGGALAIYPNDRHTDAGLRLVGRGLLEGLITGGFLGTTIFLVWAMGGALFGLEAAPRVDDYALGGLVFSSASGAVLGLASSLVALVSMGVLARLHPRTWTSSRAAWLLPAGAVGLTTLGIAASVDFWALYAAVLPAAVLTSWRAHRAVSRLQQRATRR